MPTKRRGTGNGTGSQPSKRSTTGSRTGNHNNENGKEIEKGLVRCPELEQKYKAIAKIGQGTFGEVWKAKCLKTSRIVALKKVLMENEQEGFPLTTLREIQLLQRVRRDSKGIPHQNVVELIEICRTRPDSRTKKAETHLVFEFCEHDLAGILLNKNINFTLPEKKHLMQQLLEGLFWVHKNKVLHRDMKPANILINKKGILKLADFGLAKKFTIPKAGCKNKYTNRVVTLWYRPPELLLGERNYGPPIDTWGAGCILAELFVRSHAIMMGRDEQDQLIKIQQWCGGINPQVWSEVEELPLYKKIKFKEDLKNMKSQISKRMKHYTNDVDAINLIEQMLTLNPKSRLNCDRALDHDFFWSDPMPICPIKTLEKLDKSMFEYLSRNQGKQASQPVGNPLINKMKNEGAFDRTY